MKKITVPLSTAGIERLQKELTDYRQWQKQKAKELAERCAMLGASVASLEFSRAIYTGTKDATVKVVKKGNGYVVRADGKSVLFATGFSSMDFKRLSKYSSSVDILFPRFPSFRF